MNYGFLLKIDASVCGKLFLSSVYSLKTFWYSSEIIVQTRLLAISQDCRQSCEIVKSCENRAVGVQISDFCL